MNDVYTSIVLMLNDFISTFIDTYASVYAFAIATATIEAEQLPQHRRNELPRRMCPSG